MTPITKETLEAAGFKANPDREEYQRGPWTIIWWEGDGAEHFAYLVYRDTVTSIEQIAEVCR